MLTNNVTHSAPSVAVAATLAAVIATNLDRLDLVGAACAEAVRAAELSHLVGGAPAFDFGAAVARGRLLRRPPEDEPVTVENLERQTEILEGRVEELEEVQARMRSRPQLAAGGAGMRRREAAARGVPLRAGSVIEPVQAVHVALANLTDGAARAGAEGPWRSGCSCCCW